MSRIEDFRPYCALSRPELLTKVRQQMSEKRFNHCLRVEAKILEMANDYPIDPVQAALVALVHDYAKERPLEELQSIVDVACLDPRLKGQDSQILHGPVGAVLVSDELGIKDSVLLDAIRQHTIGGVQMTLLSKCLFVADGIEDGRDYPGLEQARMLAKENIDEAVFYMTKHTLKHLLEKEVLIYPETLEVYNALVSYRRGE